MTLAQFRLMVRVLKCIDYADLPMLTDDDWPKFRDNPADWMIHNSGEKVDHIWAVASRRFEEQTK
tara:strand:- start:163 stop:357 length:195 start_codon:yes stop_codon:yes gene_type:complete